MQERDRGFSPPSAETKEIPRRGDICFLWHPNADSVFSAYGLVAWDGFPDHLVGILMVDRPRLADPNWLREIETTYGGYQLVPMTATGERGLVCQMWIEPDSLPYLRQHPGEKPTAIRAALEPLLTNPPEPVFALRWDEKARAWCSQFASPVELPQEIRRAFETTGYGCLTAETNMGIVHVCHAPDSDIDGFANRPVLSQWELIDMPTAPLIRLKLAILDQPAQPYMFGSFLNVTDEDQARILAQLAGQDRLYLAFHGDEFGHRFTNIIEHDVEQRQALEELTRMAIDYLAAVPVERCDFDRAKSEYMRSLV